MFKVDEDFQFGPIQEYRRAHKFSLHNYSRFLVWKLDVTPNRKPVIRCDSDCPCDQLHSVVQLSVYKICMMAVPPFWSTIICYRENIPRAEIWSVVGFEPQEVPQKCCMMLLRFLISPAIFSTCFRNKSIWSREIPRYFGYLLSRGVMFPNWTLIYY